MPAVAAVLLAMAVMVWSSGSVRHRLPGCAEVPSPSGARAPSPVLTRIVDHMLARCAVCAAAAAAVGALVAGMVGAGLGLLAGVGLAVAVGRMESSESRRRSERIRHDLPLVVDLLASCALVGRSPDESVRLVSEAVRGPIGAALRELSARLALGADPTEEWIRLAGTGELGSLGRTMVRAIRSGAPVADSLLRLSNDRRRERRYELEKRARSVGVRAAGPLAACFLPAFMLVGVVPAVAGLFGQLGV